MNAVHWKFLKVLLDFPLSKSFLNRNKLVHWLFLSCLLASLCDFISSRLSIRCSTEKEKNHDTHKSLHRFVELFYYLLCNYESKCSEINQYSSEAIVLEDDLNLSLNLCYSCSSIASQFLCSLDSPKRQ